MCSSVLPELTFASDCRINYFLIHHDNVIKITRDLNPAKAHGYDGISIRMIKMFAASIVVLLTIIFNKALTTSVYPDIWKRGNVVPVHKKESKNLLKNYRPISSLPIFVKIFEKIIYNVLFLPGDSCTSQLLSITHDIYKAFDGNHSLEVRGVFLDISKAFDRVWHKGLLFKLKRIGIDGPLYLILENYLKNCKQRVVLNGQTSQWKDISAGVPQSAVLLMTYRMVLYLMLNCLLMTSLFSQ